MCKRLLTILVLLGCIAETTSVTAQTTYTWNGASGTAWTTASNWTPAGVPGDDDHAIIPGNLSVYPSMTTSASVKLLELRSGATLRLVGNSSTGHTTLTVTDGFTNEGTIELTNSSGGWTGNLTVTDGTLINEGTIHATGTGTGTRNLTAELDNRGTVTVDRVLHLDKANAGHKNSGTITIADELVLTISNATFTHEGGTISGADATLRFTSATLDLAVDFENPNIKEIDLNTGTVQGSGIMKVASGQLLTMRPGTITAPLENSGTISMPRNSSITAPSLSNKPGGVIRMLGNSSTGHTTLTVASGFTNEGTIELSNTSGGWAGNLTVTDGTLINEGTIHATGTGTGVRDLLAELDNRGTVQVDRAFRLNKADVIHRNNGTISISESNMTVNQSGELAAFINSGSILLSPGQALSIIGSTVFFQIGGSVTGTEADLFGNVGALNLTNTTLNLGADLTNTWFDWSLTGTVVHGPGKIVNAENRRMNLSQATINADLENRGHIFVPRNSQIASAAFSNQDGALVEISGNSSTGHSTLTIDNGFINAGSLALSNTSGNWTGNLSVTEGTLVNEGSIETTGSGTGIRDLTAVLDNRGTIYVDRVLRIGKADAEHINSGTIDVREANFTISQPGNDASFRNSGTITVREGNALTFTGGIVVNASTGGFHGGGTVSVSGTTFENSGTFAPGLRPMFGKNLIKNGDAELGPVGSASDNVNISGWTDAGAMSILPYDLTGAPQDYLQSTDPGPEDRGRNYFWGGTAAVSSITQTISLAEIRSLVDLGMITFELSGWLGGFSIQNDQIQLETAFLDADGDALGDGAVIGPVTAADREFVTGLLFRSAEGTVPEDTRSIRLTLTATRFAGTSNNGFADNLSLVLRQIGSEDEGRTTGLLTVAGTFPTTPDSARVEIALGGYTAGDEYDRLHVTDGAHLSGRLVVSLINDFVPEPGDEFTIMTFASRTGEFDEISGTVLGENLHLIPVYSNESLLLRVSGEAEPLAAPALAEPVDGSEGVTHTPTLRWESVSRATAYHVQLSTDDAFDVIVFEDENVAETSANAGTLAFNTTFFWRVRAKNDGEVSAWSTVFSFATGTGVSTEDESLDLPKEFRLAGNHPNPFNPSTRISYDIAEPAHVILHVFDALGREVAVLVDQQHAAGRYEVAFNSGNLPSGLYLYLMEAGEFREVRRMVLLK